MEEALARDEFAPLRRGVVMALGVFGVILGLLTIVSVPIQIQRYPPSKEREGRARTPHG